MLATLLAAAMITQSQPEYEMVTYQFMVFKAGPTPMSKFKAEEIGKFQKAHLDNMQRLMDEKKMLCGGPLENAGDMRGIAILDLKTKDDVVKEFANDPFVKEGLMAIDSHKWWTAKGTVQTPKVMTDLQKFTLGILVKGDKWSQQGDPKVQEGHMANIKKMADLGVLKVAGPFENAGDWRGIFIFVENDEAKLRKLCEGDPAISSGRLKMNLYGLYMGKGSVPK